MKYWKKLLEWMGEHPKKVLKFFNKGVEFIIKRMKK